MRTTWPAGAAAATGLAASLLGALLWAQNIQQVLIPSETARAVALGALGLYLAATFAQAAPMTRRIAAVCTATTAALIATGSSLSAPVEGLSFALTFMGFLPAIALIRLAFEREPALVQIGRRISGGSAAARRDAIMALGHVSGAVLTLGAFAIVGPAFARITDPQEREALALACLRGLCLSIMWTPFTVGIGFAGAHLPGVPVWQAMACGAALSALALAASMRGRPGPLGLMDALGAVGPTLIPVMGAALLLMAANALTGISTLHLVTLLAPPLCACFILWRRPAEAPQAARRLFDDLGRVGGEMLLFSASIAMGFSLEANPWFQSALANSGLETLPTAAIAAALAVVGIACALAGLHATVTGSIVAALGLGLDGALGDLSVFMLILFAWTSSAMLSVSSLAVAVTARTFEAPLRRVIWGPNLGFGLGLAAAVTATVAMAEAMVRP